MQPGTPSATAISVASLRAAHLHLFDGPKIHKDTFALQLSGAEGLEDLRARLERSKLPNLQRVSAYFTCRHRFSEDRMRAALDRGVRQVVALVSTRWRCASQASRAGSCLSKSTTRTANVGSLHGSKHSASPRPASDTSVDFASQNLKGELRGARVRKEEPTFFAWLGVTQYISEPAAIDDKAFAAVRPPMPAPTTIACRPSKYVMTSPHLCKGQ